MYQCTKHHPAIPFLSRCEISIFYLLSRWFTLVREFRSLNQSVHNQTHPRNTFFEKISFILVGGTVSLICENFAPLIKYIYWALSSIGCINVWSLRHCRLNGLPIDLSGMGSTFARAPKMKMRTWLKYMQKNYWNLKNWKVGKIIFLQ